MMFNKTARKVSGKVQERACAAPCKHALPSSSRSGLKAAAAAASVELVPNKCRTVDRPAAPISALVMTWDEAPGTSSEEEWSAWMGSELAKKLVGVTAGTSRAQVRTTGVQSARIAKGPIRAEELDLVLELEARHLKEAGKSVSGIVRVVLKTEENVDRICLSNVHWEASELTEKAMADIAMAADTPLESALACHLNDLLWDVEKRSIDESMDEDV